MRRGLRLFTVGAYVLWMSFAGRIAGAADTSRNPDRWVELGLQGGGSVSVYGNQAASSKGTTQDRGTNSSSLNFLNELLVPLNNNWSLRAAGGITSTGSGTDETKTQVGASNDNASANYLATLRYYFLDSHLGSADMSKNPDQCPSLAATWSGSTQLFNDDIATNTVAENALQNIDTLTVDTRLPVADAVTILGDVFVSRSHSAKDTTSTTAGSNSKSTSVGLGAGFRYYAVGKNFIHADRGTNPDRWSSVSLVVGGSRITRGEDDQISVRGVTTTRDLQSKTGDLTSELRLPVTNTLTLRLSLEGSWSQSEVAETAALAGSRTTTVSLTGFAGVRYYFID